MAEVPTLEIPQPESAGPDPATLELGLQRLRANQRLGAAIGAGLAAAAAGAVAWAAITVATEFQIGFMALAVGFVVGLAVQAKGKGIEKLFGFVGSTCALLGCLAGNLLSACYFFASAQGVDLLDVLGSLTPGLASDLLGATFNGMDLLFYGIAIYQAYRLSFRPVSTEEILQAAQGAPPPAEAAA